MSAIPEIVCTVTREEPLALPSLAPRGAFGIQIVACKEDLAELADLPVYGGTLMWSYSESLLEASQTSNFTLVIWSASLGGLCGMPTQPDGMILLYRANDVGADEDLGRICPGLKISVGVRQSVLKLIPSLYLSCNYEGLLCVDTDDVYDLLKRGSELRLFDSRSDDLRRDMASSVDWLCNDCSHTRPVSAACLGLYLSRSWMCGVEGLTLWLIVDSWVRELEELAKPHLVIWVVWHDGGENSVSVLAV